MVTEAKEEQPVIQDNVIGIEVPLEIPNVPHNMAELQMPSEDDDAWYVGKLNIGRNMHLAGIWRLIYMKGCLI